MKKTNIELIKEIEEMIRYNNANHEHDIFTVLFTPEEKAQLLINSIDELITMNVVKNYVVEREK